MAVADLQLNAITTSGAKIATDQSGGKDWQIMKIAFGATGTQTDVSAANPFPVDPQDRALRDLGKVDIAAFDSALIAGTATIGNVFLRNPGDSANMGDSTNPVAVSGEMTVHGGANLNTSALALEAGNLATLAGAVASNRVNVTTSGTIVAHGGVNLNTSALALEAGNLATLAGAVTASQVSVSGTVAARMGGYAQANERTAVSDGQQVDAWLDPLGRQIFLGGHASPESPVSVSGSAAGVSVIGTPGASLSLYICRGQVHASGAENKVKLREGTTGAIRWQHDCAAGGGGSKFDFGDRGWKLPANTALVADIETTAAWVNIEQYYIAP